MADPLHERDETLPALRKVLRAAGPYLDALPERAPASVPQREAPAPTLAGLGDDVTIVPNAAGVTGGARGWKLMGR
ncbi:hypothetical protein Drose_22810 [Dactylosporangium roseum]|uniref:Uncharacterized protein n=1 Tax=Dactylosporangium roseum TaxID=47989 RepID=A0ABY5YX25_9ACTN|nr:hypothetical protein [Dactylosporangium roseum]UWZ34082.1 hypothetical protein Drose_22810 [Dactylosporangium roseum]